MLHPARCLHVQQRKRPLIAEGGTLRGRQILTRIRLPRNSRDLLHGTDGFTSPPKEVVLRIFLPLKIRRLRPGLNPRTWVPKASTLTPRPPKSVICITYIFLILALGGTYFSKNYWLLIIRSNLRTLWSTKKLWKIKRHSVGQKTPRYCEDLILINLLTSLAIIAYQMNITHTNSSYFLQLHHPVIYIQVSQVSFFPSCLHFWNGPCIFEMDPVFPARQTLLNPAVTERDRNMKMRGLRMCGFLTARHPCTYSSTTTNLSPSEAMHRPLVLRRLCSITIGCRTPDWNQLPSHLLGKRQPSVKEAVRSSGMRNMVDAKKIWVPHGKGGRGHGGEPSSTVVHGPQCSVQCPPLTRQSTMYSSCCCWVREAHW